jgi:MFS family permease
MKQRIITRTVLLVSLVSLFTDIASEMLYPVMPIYLRSIGFSVLLIGVLEGIAEATAGLSKGYFGNLSDKKGSRMLFVRWGYSLSAISKPLLAIFIYPVWIFFARTLDRLGKGIRTSARDALLSDETTKEHKAKVFGFHRALDTTGAALGPIIALLYLYFHPGQYKWLFIIAFFPGMLAVFITFLIKEKNREHIGKKERTNFLSYLKYWKKASPVYKKLVLGMLFFTFFNSSDAFLLLALKQNGMSDMEMIGFYIFYNLVYALLSYPLGAMADKLGMKSVLVLGLFIFSIVYGTMAFANTFWVFGIIFLLYAIYAASSESIAKAWISNISDKSETATAIGFFTSFSSICTLLASSFAGFLWYAFNSSVMFIVSGVGVGLVVIYFLFALPGLKKQNVIS